MSWRRLYAVRPRRPWVSFRPATTSAVAAHTPPILMANGPRSARRGLAILLRPPHASPTSSTGAPRLLQAASVRTHHTGLVVFVRPPLGAPPSTPGGAHLCITRISLPPRPHRDGHVVSVRPPLPNPTPGPRIPRIIVPWGNAQAGSRFSLTRQPITLFQRPPLPPPTSPTGHALTALAVLLTEHYAGQLALTEQLQATVAVED